MEKTTFYFVRHGQSEGNLHDLFLGHTDLELTELGHTQAELAAGFLDGVEADVIVSSDLKRAYQTALHTARRKGLPVLKNRAMREIFAGEWEAVPFEELETRFRDSFLVWLERFEEARCDGGESVRELYKRICGGVTALAYAFAGKTVLVFTHATPIRLLKGWSDGGTPEKIRSVPWPSNASVTKAEYENGVFRVLEYSIDSFQGSLVTRLDWVEE